MFRKKATDKQVNANRENAQHSTGPKTEEGKLHSRLNNFRHGLAGHTMVHVLLDWECEEDFARLEAELFAEHDPQTTTEKLLVGKMAQHYWLSQRAITIQSMAISHDGPFRPGAEQQIGTYIRYQAQHERAFRQALHDLLKLRSERRKAEIGFESEKRREQQDQHRAAREHRQVERHHFFVAEAQNKLARQPSDASAIQESNSVGLAGPSRSALPGCCLEERKITNTNKPQTVLAAPENERIAA